MVSGPLIPGSRRSIKVMSGVCSANAVRAAAPSPASATTCRSGSASIMVRRPTRTTGWSSTMRMRIFFGPAAVSGIGNFQFLSCGRSGDLYAGSAARSALDGELAQSLGPLAHAHQPEVAGLDPLREGRVEAAPVVGDG